MMAKRMVLSLLPTGFLAVSLCAVATSAPAKVPQDKSPAAAIAAAVQPFVDRQELAGAVMLVATKDKVLSLSAVGWADVAAGKPMRADALFWIASQSKPITAAALMILVDEGKVALDDPVEKYLPEFKGQMVLAEKDANHVLLRKPAHPITVRNILSHTSGLAFCSPVEEPTLDGLPLRTCILSYAALPLVFEPDSRYLYSNEGINTAGRIIEVVSGMTYERFMDERLFKPLGMKDTTFWPDEAQVARLAKAYKPGPGGKGLVEMPIAQLRYPLTDRAARFPMPGGGLFSTAGDMARFFRMVFNGGQLDGRRYLSEAAVSQMTSRQTPKNLKESYGLGWSVGETSYGHGGALSTNATIEPQQGMVFIWLVQHAGFPGDGKKAQDAFRKAAVDAFAPRAAGPATKPAAP